MLDDLRVLRRYATGLRRHVAHPFTTADCHELIREGLSARTRSFLRLLEVAVYAQPRSPYRRLLEHAGVELGDVAALLETHGLEVALDVLYDAGVYVTHDEYRGRTPVRRGSLRFDFEVDATRNTSGRPEFAGRSGGSRGPGRRTLQSFEAWTHDAAYVGSFLSAFGLTGRPVLVWYPSPPIQSGLTNVLALTKLGNPPERWYCPSPIRAQPEWAKALVVVALTSMTSRLAGTRVPVPRHLPPERARDIAEWASLKVAAGTPPLIVANPSASARICAAAAEGGVDIAGTFFRMGGEPFTPAKESLLTSVGASGACFFYNGEVGGLSGAPCADPAAPGDVHLCAHRLALSTRAVAVRDGTSVPALCFTTIHRAVRSVAVNLVTDDFAVVEERECGCELSSLGLRTHMHTIRSFEKLTGEGVTFLGEPLVDLVEHVLPARHGGAMTDYQFAEQEVGGVTRLELRVSPRLGPMDAQSVVESVLGHLEASEGGGRAMANIWRATGTVEIVREDPQVTRAGKVLPLALAARLDQPASASRQ